LSEALKTVRYTIGPLLNVLKQIYPTIGQFTPFVSGAFALYYVAKIIYKYKEPLGVSREKLVEEEVKLSATLEKLQRRLAFLEERERRIRERLDKVSQAEQRVLKAELESSSVERALVEDELNTTLLKMRFVRVLQVLTAHREALKQRGIWVELEGMMKGEKPWLVKRVEKELKREGERHQILIGCLSELEGLIKEVAKAPTQEVFEKRAEAAQEATKATPQENVVVVEDEFLVDAKPEDWCGVFEEAVKNKKFVEIRARRGFGEEVYRNILLAFLMTPLGYRELSRLFKGGGGIKFILRALVFLKGLKEKGEKSFEPTSSERVDADEVIRLLKEREEAVPSEDPTLKVTRYEFSDPDGNRWVLSREVKMDERMRAKNITYRLGKAAQ
jgi:hypothetical protein